MARTPSEILEDLDRVQAEIAAGKAAGVRRLELWEEARALEPPITNRVLAEHAGGITEVAVITQLKKARERRAEAAAP